MTGEATMVHNMHAASSGEESIKGVGGKVIKSKIVAPSIS